MDVVNEIKKTPCNHLFCQVCLDKWIEEEFRSKQEVTCPMCRKNLPFVFFTKYCKRCNKCQKTGKKHHAICHKEEFVQIFKEINACCTLSQYIKQQEFLLKQCAGFDNAKTRQQYHITIEKDCFQFFPQPKPNFFWINSNDGKNIIEEKEKLQL